MPNRVKKIDGKNLCGIVEIAKEMTKTLKELCPNPYRSQ